MLLLLNFPSFTQSLLEEGYVIPIDGSKQECLIKYERWVHSPTSISFELNGETQTGDLSTLSEFGINDKVKYINATVNVDQSSDDPDFFDTKRDPEYKSQTVFLNLIVEGYYNLYEFKNYSTTRYFYSVNNGDIVPLVYKTYLVNEHNVRDNNQYRQQLTNLFAGIDLSKKEIDNLIYKKVNLRKIFVKANTKSNSESITYNPKREVLNVGLKTKISQTDFTFTNRFDYNGSFDNITIYGFGVEIEYFLPYNNGMLSLYTDPVYRSALREKSYTNEDLVFQNYVSRLTYSVFEFPVGLRFNKKFSSNFKVYANIFGLVDVPLNENTIVMYRADNDERLIGDTNKINNIGLGIGTELFNRLSIELKYQTSSSLFFEKEEYTIYTPYYSLNLGYSFFNLKK